jgi:hypothetical protein
MNPECTSGNLRSGGRRGVCGDTTADLTELIGPKMSQAAVVIRRGTLLEDERHITDLAQCFRFSWEQPNGQDHCAALRAKAERGQINPAFDRYQVGRWICRLAEHGRGIALLHARTETAWFRICWGKAGGILFMPQRLIFVKPDGSPCTTRSGERANSGAPPVLVAFGDYDAGRLRQFASVDGGALVKKWQLFGAVSLFSEAAE